MLLAFLHLGARRSEIFRIKMSDLDFENARVRLWTRKRKGGNLAFGYHTIRHLTATILYHKGYGLSLIQQVLRHQNPSTTERYLKNLGIEKVREGLEMAFVRKSATVIPFSKQKTSNA